VVTGSAAFDRDVRIAIARAIREDGRIPRIADVARALRCDETSVDASFARMTTATSSSPSPARARVAREQAVPGLAPPHRVRGRGALPRDSPRSGVLGLR